jgi:hypothetical protein
LREKLVQDASLNRHSEKSNILKFIKTIKIEWNWWLMMMKRIVLTLLHSDQILKFVRVWCRVMVKLILINFEFEFPWMLSLAILHSRKVLVLFCRCPLRSFPYSCFAVLRPALDSDCGSCFSNVLLFVVDLFDASKNRSFNSTNGFEFLNDLFW